MKKRKKRNTTIGKHFRFQQKKVILPVRKTKETIKRNVMNFVPFFNLRIFFTISCKNVLSSTDSILHHSIKYNPKIHNNEVMNRERERERERER